MKHESIKIVISDISSMVDFHPVPANNCNVYFFSGKVQLSQFDVSIITDHILINVISDNWELTPFHSPVHVIILTIPISVLEAATVQEVGYFEKKGSLIILPTSSPFEKIKKIANLALETHGVQLLDLRIQKYELLAELKKAILKQQVIENLPEFVPTSAIFKDKSNSLPASMLVLMELVYEKYIKNPSDTPPPTLAEIAEELKISLSMFTMTFKKHYGKAFYQAYLDRKMEYARELLAQGFKAVEVSYIVGYTSPIKFNKRFQKHFGITPYQYKQLHYAQ